ncbi:MAG TPA: sigma-70 family RNA polymerase sigma factor [Planctomycetota bacterium]|jgi:RNA polymerase sigma factor (sigma-70 family)|nr:sigma-70 family RNA polymerase sigma factor [Planctomycetota bacterium]
MNTTDLLARIGDDNNENEPCPHLNELCARYLPKIREWAHRTLGDKLRKRIDSDDPVQDTFLAFFASIKSLRPKNGEEFTALMRKLLRNRLADAWDYHKADRRDVRRDQPWSSEVVRRFEADAKRAPTPADHAMRVEDARILIGAIELLPDTHREVIHLIRHAQGRLSAKDLAASLNISTEAASKRRARAILALKGIVDKVRKGDLGGAMEGLEDDDPDPLVSQPAM